MKETKRFGRVIPLPSTAAIKHQIEQMGEGEKIDIPSADGTVPEKITDSNYIGAGRHREIW